MAKYRVIDRETGNEDLHYLETSAKTDRGWLRVFYSRWSAARRGDYYPTVGDGRTDINSWYSGRLVASFILVE